MKPLGNYLLLSTKEKENKSSIFIPERFLKKEKRGVVIKIGRFVQSDIEIGDSVYFATGGIKETEEGLFVPERSITGIIKE